MPTNDSQLEFATRVFQEVWDGPEKDSIDAKCRYLAAAQKIPLNTIQEAFSTVFTKDTPLPPALQNLDALFFVGQIIEHRKYDYRGVIVAYDMECQASNEWYEHMQCKAKGVTREQPWYHVLVDNAEHSTYVAQQNLKLSLNRNHLNHPWLDVLFRGLENNRYIRSDVPWGSI